MDLMQKLGGRKFLMAVLVIGCAVLLDTKTDKGLTTTMAGFLVAMVSAFHMANYATTAKYMSKPGGSNGKPDLGLHEKLDSLTNTVNTAMGSESKDQLVSLLSAVINNTEGLKTAVAQTGQAVVNLANMSKRG